MSRLRQRPHGIAAKLRGMLIRAGLPEPRDMRVCSCWWCRCGYGGAPFRTAHGLDDCTDCGLQHVNHRINSSAKLLEKSRRETAEAYGNPGAYFDEADG